MVQVYPIPDTYRLILYRYLPNDYRYNDMTAVQIRQVVYLTVGRLYTGMADTELWEN